MMDETKLVFSSPLVVGLCVQSRVFRVFSRSFGGAIHRPGSSVWHKITFRGCTTTVSDASPHAYAYNEA